jgi:hypothetical protein
MLDHRRGLKMVQIDHRIDAVVIDCADERKLYAASSNSIRWVSMELRVCDLPIWSLF